MPLPLDERTAVDICMCCTLHPIGNANKMSKVFSFLCVHLTLFYKNENCNVKTMYIHCKEK